MRVVDHAVQDSLDAGLARAKLRGVLSGILIFLVFSRISIILWIGGQDLMAGRIGQAIVLFYFLCLFGGKLDWNFIRTRG